MTRTIVLSLLSLLLAACSQEPTVPRLTAEGLPEGLEVSLVVEPEAVGPHQPFTVRFAAANPTSDPIRITTSHGCLVLPGVYRDGRRIPFQGSAWGCTAAITTHVFAPGETKSVTWEMRAELYAENPGEREGAPAPAGIYRVRAEFDVPPPDGSTRKPGVEATLRVR